MSKDLAVKEKPNGISEMSSWQVMREQANVLLKSGFLPSTIKTPEQAIAIAMTGKELQIGMMEALRSINVIAGKITVSPQLMLALARRTGEFENLEQSYENDGTCVITIKRKGQAAHTTRFGPAEAKSMGLAGKDNYAKQAKTMYQWRCLAANLRVTFPDAISGLYTPEEIDPDLKFNVDGEIVDVPAPVGGVVKPAISAADIASGTVQEDKKESPPPSDAGMFAEGQKKAKCAQCGREANISVLLHNEKTYGKTLCFPCGKKAEKSKTN